MVIRLSIGTGFLMGVLAVADSVIIIIHLGDLVNLASITLIGPLIKGVTYDQILNIEVDSAVPH